MVFLYILVIVVVQLDFHCFTKFILGFYMNFYFWHSQKLKS